MPESYVTSAKGERSVTFWQQHSKNETPVRKECIRVFICEWQQYSEAQSRQCVVLNVIKTGPAKHTGHDS